MTVISDLNNGSLVDSVSLHGRLVCHGKISLRYHECPQRCLPSFTETFISVSCRTGTGQKRTYTHMKTVSEGAVLRQAAFLRLDISSRPNRPELKGQRAGGRNYGCADITVVYCPHIGIVATINQIIHAGTEVDSPSIFIAWQIPRAGPVHSGLERRKQDQILVAAGEN